MTHDSLIWNELAPIKCLIHRTESPHTEAVFAVRLSGVCVVRLITHDGAGSLHLSSHSRGQSFLLAFQWMLSNVLDTLWMNDAMILTLDSVCVSPPCSPSVNSTCTCAGPTTPTCPGLSTPKTLLQVSSWEPVSLHFKHCTHLKTVWTVLLTFFTFILWKEHQQP